MLKITKGLKKKKKGKKSKHKEDELFDSAELEEYRRQQQEKQKEGEGEPSEPSEESEEWLKFKALTSGVDDILKKTQGDLDRIKSTSYFQKKPPGPSEPPKEAQPATVEKAPPKKSKWVGFEDGSVAEEEQGDERQQEEPGKKEPQQAEEHVEEEEEESEFEDDQDDIFDTSFVDVVASGEVKLAFVPDSPIEALSGPDPFDTSIVDKVLDPKEQKKTLVNLGCAVEVLTGKLDKSPCRELASTPRKRPKPQDLLLGSFDEGDLKPVVVTSEPEPKSILDDDPVFEEETSAVLGLPPVTPVVEAKPVCPPPFKENPVEKTVALKELVEEFVPALGLVENKTPAGPEEDDLDDEFAVLAAESVYKKAPPPRPQQPVLKTEGEEVEEEEAFAEGDDPFDTSFAAEVLPGKFELKLIEKEILEKEIPVSVNTVEEQINSVLQNSEFSVKHSKSNDVFVNGLEPLSLKHRDLLGGSTTDLSKINQLPIAPKSVSDEPDFNISDPFDTSIAEVFSVPGKTELKVLEKELLENNSPKPLGVNVDIDDEFDPRAEEKAVSKPPVKQPPRPDNLLVGKRPSVPKVVAFDVEFSKEVPDLLAVGQDESNKIGKPLTPYYPPQTTEQAKTFEDDADPFDTSHVINAPGKFELKILEKELVQESKSLKHSLSDPDFDPRGIEQNTPQPVEKKPADLPDILSSEVVVDTKLHTPVAPKKIVEESPTFDHVDPFDTSIVNSLVPGKAEIKILENELIHSQETPQVAAGTSILEKLRRDSDSFSSLRKLSVTDVLELPPEDTSVKPLTPLGPSSSFDLEDESDPFDTSAVGDILPGKTEIKILESELMLN